MKSRRDPIFHPGDGKRGQRRDPEPAGDWEAGCPEDEPDSEPVAERHRVLTLRTVATILAMLGVVVVVALTGKAGFGGSGQATSGGPVGSSKASAAPIDGVRLDGQQVSLAAYAGKPLLLVFWASW